MAIFRWLARPSRLKREFAELEVRKAIVASRLQARDPSNDYVLVEPGDSPIEDAWVVDREQLRGWARAWCAHRMRRETRPKPGRPNNTAAVDADEHAENGRAGGKKRHMHSRALKDWGLDAYKAKVGDPSTDTEPATHAARRLLLEAPDRIRKLLDEDKAPKNPERVLAESISKHRAELQARG